MRKKGCVRSTTAPESLFKKGSRPICFVRHEEQDFGFLPGCTNFFKKLSCGGRDSTGRVAQVKLAKNFTERNQVSTILLIFTNSILSIHLRHWITHIFNGKSSEGVVLIANSRCSAQVTGSSWHCRFGIIPTLTHLRLIRTNIESHSSRTFTEPAYFCLIIAASHRS